MIDFFEIKLMMTLAVVATFCQWHLDFRDLHNTVVQMFTLTRNCCGWVVASMAMYMFWGITAS